MGCLKLTYSTETTAPNWQVWTGGSGSKEVKEVIVAQNGGTDPDYPWYKFFNDGNPGGEALYEINKYNPLALVVNGVSGLVTGKDWERGNPVSKGDALVNIASVVPLGRASKSTMIIVRDAKGALKALTPSEAPEIWKTFSAPTNSPMWTTRVGKSFTLPSAVERKPSGFWNNTVWYAGKILEFFHVDGMRP